MKSLICFLTIYILLFGSIGYSAEKIDKLKIGQSYEIIDKGLEVSSTKRGVLYFYKGQEANDVQLVMKSLEMIRSIGKGVQFTVAEVIHEDLSTLIGSEVYKQASLYKIKQKITDEIVYVIYPSLQKGDTLNNTCLKRISK
jgi:hypothetical protein